MNHPSHRPYNRTDAFYAFYACWFYFPQPGALAEGTSLPSSRRPRIQSCKFTWLSDVITTELLGHGHGHGIFILFPEPVDCVYPMIHGHGHGHGVFILADTSWSGLASPTVVPHGHGHGHGHGRFMSKFAAYHTGE
jgi:hypothetical protein